MNNRKTTVTLAILVGFGDRLNRETPCVGFLNSGSGRIKQTKCPIYTGPFQTPLIKLKNRAPACSAGSRETNSQGLLLSVLLHRRKTGASESCASQ